jgi:pyridoxine 5-phosphate synthase
VGAFFVSATANLYHRMIRFSVNLNKVALVRNTRDHGIPSLIRAAQLCLESGAHGITVHPRPDARHVLTKDVHEIAPLVREFGAEFNIEGYPSEPFLDLVCEVRPNQCTLVPDTLTQRTSDHGWDIPSNREMLLSAIETLHNTGIRTSLFMDAATADDADRIEQAYAVGADRVELYTEPWARAYGTEQQTKMLTNICAAAQRAHDAGLGVNAGHDLNLLNLRPFIDAIPYLQEVSIGHAFITDALEIEYITAVQLYLDVLNAKSDL